MPAYFRANFRQFMSLMSINISQDIHNRDGKFDLGKYPFSFPVYRKICEIIYFSSKPGIFPGSCLSLIGH